MLVLVLSHHAGAEGSVEGPRDVGYVDGHAVRMVTDGK